jgi:hypothetical protein
MPFCTSCGANVDAGMKFCGKCGAAMSGATPAAPGPAATASSATPAAPAAAAPSKGGSGVLKVILVILGVLLLFAVLISAVVGYVGYRGYKAVKEEQAKLGDMKVDVDTGTASAGDAAKIAQQMEVEVYPGAEAQKGGGAVSMGGFSVAGADFLTSDSPSQVADFYKKQYPKAMLVSEGEDHYSIMVTTSKGMVTVAVQPYDGKTKISIARMAGVKPPSGGQPN